MMELEREYRAALELASTGRYQDAAAGLEMVLTEKPGHIPALLLLGKVAFYRRHYRRSQACFQTALIYEPENLSAYFGLSFYRERKGRRLFVAGLLSLLIILLLAGAMAYYALSSHLQERFSRLEKALETQAEYNAAQQERQEALLSGLVELSRRTEDIAGLQEIALAQHRGRLLDLSAQIGRLADSQITLLDRLEELVEATRTEMEKLRQRLLYGD